MLGFGAPTGLIALIALTIPIAIHLWSRKKTKRVQVGSVRFLTSSVTPRARKLRLTDLPLLLLRLAIVTLLAFLVARPYARFDSGNSTPTRWLLVEPGIVVDSATDRKLDSLEQAGFERRQLAAGFPLSFASATPEPAAPNLWSLLREADALIPDGSQIVVASSGRASLFVGKRPTLSSRVYWIDVLEPNRDWIHRAAVNGNNTILVTIGSSSPERTVFSSSRVEIPHEGERVITSNGVEIARQGSSLTVTNLVNPADRVVTTISGEPLRITVIASVERSDDAEYIERAIETLSSELVVPLTTDIRGGSNTSVESEYYFWLSPNPIPDWLTSRMEAGAVLFEDARGTSFQESEMSMVSEETLPGQTTTRMTLTPISGTSTLWWAGSEPLLTLDAIGAGLHFRFGSRFHHEFGNLVVSATFPELLQSLLLPRGDVSLDSRVLPIDQRAVFLDPSPETRLPTPKPVEAEVWILVMALFGFERVVSSKEKT